MSATVARTGRPKGGARRAVVAAAAIVLVIAMAVDTRVVRVGSSLNLKASAFSPAAFGQANFPKVQAYVVAHAVDAATLAAAINKDSDAAAKQYGVSTGTGTEFCVKFTGTAGKSDLGVYDVTVPGMPSGVAITLQTGPAIVGTDLRDASGTITFGQFHNQIEYQNAAGGLSNEMKKEVLAKIDTAKLTGKTVAVVGAFAMSDPTAWQVTPVRLEVK